MSDRSPLFLLLAAMLFACADSAPHENGGAASTDTAAAFLVDLQGHRGARGLVPENTIPAFKKALELDVTTLELDVVITADSHVVVSHEPWFASSICSTPAGDPIPEVEERSHNIFRMPYETVRAYDCGSRGNPHFAEQEPLAAYKPRLDSAVIAAENYAEAIGRPAPRYNIELKSREEFDGTFTPDPQAFARLVYDVVSRLGIKDRTTIQSFDPRSLMAMQVLDEDVSLALLVDNDLGFEANLERLNFTPDIYSPHYRLVNEELVRSTHQANVLIIPWTVNDPDAMRRLIALGVDGIITDYPDRALTVLGRGNRTP